MARPTSMLTSLSVPFSPSTAALRLLARRLTEEDFLQPGNKQVAAGTWYTAPLPCWFTPPDAVFTPLLYNPSLGVFCLCQERMRFPEKGKTYSINKGNYIKFPNGVKKYIKFCQEEDKSTNRPYASHVISAHWLRISTVTY